MAHPARYTNSAHSIFVTPQWLARQTSGGTATGLTIVDCGRTYEEYLDSRIPGALYVDQETLCLKVHANSENNSDNLAHQLSAAGIGDGAVVCYDDAGGIWSARLLWMLEALGHTSVSILNGGFAAWCKEWHKEMHKEGSKEEHTEKHIEKHIEQGTPRTPQPAVLTPRLQPERIVSMSELLGHHQNECLLLDVRSAAEYQGTDVKARRGGHIPGAVNIEWSTALDDNGSINVDNTHPPYNSFNQNRVVTYCQVGVCAAHTYAVMRHLGHHNVAVYDGSWEEWGNNPHTPVETQKSAAPPTDPTDST